MSDAYTAVCLTREEAHTACLRGYAHAQAMLANGENVLVSVGPAEQPIGIKQRGFLHGPVLGQIAEQVRVDGQRYTTDVWKEHYRRRFVGSGGFRWESMRLPGQKRATPRRVRISTEELGVRAYAEFTEQVIQDAVVEHAVEFVFTHEEQELRAHKPRRKPDAEQ